MRRSLALLAPVLLLVLAVPARAQEAPPEGPEVEMAKGMVKVLKDELELTDEQTSKITETLQSGIRDGMKKMMKHMGEEEPDEEQIKKEADDMRSEITSKIKALLDDEQKKEFDVLVKEFDQRAGSFNRGRGAPGGDAAAWLEGELPSRERLLLKAENALLLTQDEKRVVLPKVEAVIAIREKMLEARREERRNLGQALRAKAKEDEVRERLHGLRNKQAGLQKDLVKAEEELRELVTIDQEARLVAIGILD
jgi:hypothetical protein